MLEMVGWRERFFEEESMEKLAKATHDFALWIDRTIVALEKWPPLVQWAVFKALYPLVLWRMKGVARTIDRECKRLPATTWAQVEKHGENVVYCRRDKLNVHTKEMEEVGAYVVDYKNKTLRTVTDLPDEYKWTGATF